MADADVPPVPNFPTEVVPYPLVKPDFDAEGQVVTDTVASSGGGIRTPDTRIMIPQTDRRKSRNAKNKASISDNVALPLPYEAFSPELTAVVEAWADLPEAIRAGIVAMVKATVGG